MNGLEARAPASRETPEEPERDLAGALHEVSNSLTVVLGWLEAAAAELPAGPARDALDVASTHARRGYRVARRAIGAAVPGEETLRSAGELAREAALGVKQEAVRRQVEVSVEASPEADLLIEHSPAALQILLNLLLNAIAFSPSGGVVRLRLSCGPEDVIFIIQDEGPGVPAERADELLSAPESTRNGGAGVGLTHSAALATAKGASLRLDRTGPGASFSLSWPSGEARSGARHAVISSPIMLGSRVLVLEDDPAVLMLLEVAFEARGAQVMSAKRVPDAVDLLGRQAKFDVALVDLSPLQDAPERQLADFLDAVPEVPVVVISGSPDGIPPALSPRVAAWVRKPFEIGELIATLQQVLGEV